VLAKPSTYINLRLRKAGELLSVVVVDRSRFVACFCASV